MIKLRTVSLAFLSLLLLAPMARAEACVVLLHGLARSATSMWLLELRLQDEGFFTVNESYPSTTTPSAN